MIKIEEKIKLFPLAPMGALTPGLRKLDPLNQRERKREREEEKNAVNSGHLVLCSAHKPLRPIMYISLSPNTMSKVSVNINVWEN